MDTVSAIDKVFLFRIEDESGDAWKVAFQTDIETSESRDYDATPHKDGMHQTPGAYEGSHSLSAFLAKDDEYVKKLKQQIRARNPKKLEVWEIDRSDLDSAEALPGEYSLDVITDVTVTSGSEGSVEVSVETSVVDTIIDGTVNVTPALSDLLKQITAEREFVQPTTEGA